MRHFQIFHACAAPLGKYCGNGYLEERENSKNNNLCPTSNLKVDKVEVYKKSGKANMERKKGEKGRKREL